MLVISTLSGLRQENHELEINLDNRVRLCREDISSSSVRHPSD